MEDLTNNTEGMEDTTVQWRAKQPTPMNKETHRHINTHEHKRNHHTSKHKGRANLDSDNKSHLEGNPLENTQVSPKRPKMFKTDRKVLATQEKTRSKTRLKPRRGCNTDLLALSFAPIIYTNKLITLNINWISSSTRTGIIEGFLQSHIGFVLAIQVTHYNFHAILRNDVYVNEGAEKRGTAILAERFLNIPDI